MPTGEDRIRQLGAPVATQSAGSVGSALRRSARQSRNMSRAEMFESAEQHIERIRASMLTRVADLAIHARMNSAGTAVTLRDATLSIPEAESAPAGALVSPRVQRAPFDVVAHTSVEVRTPVDRFGYSGRSHSLWFCDARKAGEYRWYETAFMLSPGYRRPECEPFALPPAEDAAGALSVLFERCEAALPFAPIEGAGLGAFIDKWLNYLADAAEGNMRRPAKLPERDPKKSWRRN